MPKFKKASLHLSDGREITVWVEQSSDNASTRAMKEWVKLTDEYSDISLVTFLNIKKPKSAITEAQFHQANK